MDPDLALLYLDFVAERHAVWERRQAGASAPWTDDPVISRMKFTNVFRVLDYGSQFLLRELLDPELSWRERAFRCVAYRMTNLPEPWQHVRGAWGRYPYLGDAEDGSLVKLWEDYRDDGGVMFSTAYRYGYVPTGVTLLDGVAQAFAELPDALTKLEHSSDRLEVLKQLPRVGQFLAMQIVTDIGYFDPTHDEGVEIVTGNGSAAGLKVLFPDEPAARHPYLLRLVTEDWSLSPQLALPGGGVRHPSLMDVQNTFCEFFKYHRELGRSRSTRYHPQHNPVPPLLPAHWSQS